MLQFREILFEDYQTVYNYTSLYGEGSCQHSFTSMYLLYDKYGDMICEEENVLYIHRSHLDDENYRVYLAPMCSESKLKNAYEILLDDARKYNKKVKFESLTEKHVSFLKDNFSGIFSYIEDRNLAEYIVLTDEMKTYCGSKLAKRREEINHFWRVYGDRCTIEVMDVDKKDEICSFHEYWIEQNASSHDVNALKIEYNCVKKGLDNFDKLHLEGIVVRIDGKIVGYEIGTKLSDDYFDAIYEKGDKDCKSVYKVLRQEFCKKCVDSAKYYNLEEDLGVEGLRHMKNIYQPVFLINKIVVTER